MHEPLTRARPERDLLSRLWQEAHRRTDAEGLRRAFVENLRFRLGVKPAHATARDLYAALAYTVRDLLVERLQDADRGFARNGEKVVCYLSMEFLIGRLLVSNLLNLGLLPQMEEALRPLGLNVAALADVEPEQGLGNGGLGRLAACYLDSLATLGYPAVGYGIRYEHGMFRQEIVDGRQIERLDHWLRFPNPWEIPRPHASVKVEFGGRVVETVAPDGAFRPHWIPSKAVIGVPFDTGVVGYRGRSLNFLRLWSAKAAAELDLDRFHQGDYVGAAESKSLSESISKILYPNDQTARGRELRLVQEYFFVACSVHDFLRRFLERHQDLRRLPDQVAMQLNDTHPALAVAELQRTLMDEHGVPWDAAWDLVTRTTGYTNHTLLPEALEKWPTSLFEKNLPRHLQIIREIDRRFAATLEVAAQDDPRLIERTSLFEGGPSGHVRMAHLAVVGSHRVNGVSKLHSELLRTRLFPEFDRLAPGKFRNVTNGVTPRLWILKANPRLADLFDRELGDEWAGSLELLARLGGRADDAAFRAELRTVKRRNKEECVEYVRRESGIALSPDMLFDVHVKRIHEYKRQLMNALGVLIRYRRLKTDPAFAATAPPRAVIFAGKAAPGYAAAKLIIRFICRVADLVNADPEMRGKLSVIFLPNYGVSMAERLIPAADLSEQISTAGCEASGTGNMKFAMNGALTIGTLDGANIELRDAVGHDHFFLFGRSAEEIEDLRRPAEGEGAGGRRHDPYAVLAAHPEIAAALAFAADGGLSPDEPELFRSVTHGLTSLGDRWFVLADLPDYLAAQDRVDARFRDPDAWWRSVVHNLAGSGPFSSDRAVRDYADGVWGLNQPAPK
jgi:glycogen phosphorylase